MKSRDILVAADTESSSLVGKCAVLSDVTFITSSDIEETVANVECENLFVISSCHGSMNGIDAASPIKPAALNAALKRNHHAKNILVVLGQCYAGIFNYMDVRDETKNIVYIGATDIDTSLSYRLDRFSWNTNISVFALFSWLASPRDVDGDRNYSVTDLYKYIVYFTNKVTNDIEKDQTSRLVDASVKLKMEELRGTLAVDGYMSQITREAADVIKNFIIPHQTPWMLNALAASSMHIEIA